MNIGTGTLGWEIVLKVSHFNRELNNNTTVVTGAYTTGEPYFH